MANQENFPNDDFAVGGPPVPAADNGAGYFQPPVPVADGLLASDQARSVAEVQAALVVAAGRPRNEFSARERLLQACQRQNLASGALYQYSRGGSAITGPSIRLAEAAARAWGNMTYGFRELSRRAGESECEAFAWDWETNTKAVRQFAIKHRRDTKKGGYDVTDERDIYEIMANQAQRRVRAAILEIIPGDIIEDAVSECEKTMKAKIGNLADAVEKLLAAFAALGVPREAIEKRLGHRIDAIQPAQVINFRKIYTSIHDGMSEPKDWFELDAAPAPAKADKTAGKAAPAGGQPAAPPKEPSNGAAAASPADQKAEPSTPAAGPAQPAQAAPSKEAKATGKKAADPAQAAAPQGTAKPDPAAPANHQTAPAEASPAPPAAKHILPATQAALDKELGRLGTPGHLPSHLAERFGTGDPSELDDEILAQECLKFLRAMN